MRSSSKLMFCGDRAFSVAAPRLWNNLPLNIGSARTHFKSFVGLAFNTLNINILVLTALVVVLVVFIDLLFFSIFYCIIILHLFALEAFCIVKHFVELWTVWKCAI